MEDALAKHNSKGNKSPKEKTITVKQEEDQDSDYLDKKKPAQIYKKKPTQTTKQTTKKILIAEGHAKARAWVAERSPNPKVHSSPANLKSIQERKQEEQKKRRILEHETNITNNTCSTS